MRRALLLCLGLGLCAQPARAQTRVYVAGGVFADIVRHSQIVGPDDFRNGNLQPRDSETVGGGGRLGAFLSPEWSLEISADIGRTATESRKTSIRVPAEFAVSPAPEIEDRSSDRLSVVSVLIGYHPAPHRRIRPGFFGGLGFAHKRAMFTAVSTAFLSVSSPGQPGVSTFSMQTSEFTIMMNTLTATIAGEAAIELSRHAAIVPEMRAHAGGLGAIVLRPGVALRWTF